MPRVERGLLLAAALAGAFLAGCQRQPPGTTLLPPTPTAASGEPKPPTPDIEATVQARVRATMATGQSRNFSEAISEDAWKPFRSQKFPYEIIYPPGWKTNATENSDLFSNNDDQEVLISAQPLLPNEGPGEFMQKQHRRIREDSEYIISVTKREVAGRDGILFSARMRNGDDSTVAIFSDNKLGWIISLNTPPSATTSGQKNLDSILDSFKVTGSSIQLPTARVETPPKLPTQIEAPKPALIEKPSVLTYKTFFSLNYPYKIDYPNSWLAISDTSSRKDQITGPTVYGFLSAVIIEPEPIAQHVTFDMYLQQVLEQSQLETGRRLSKEEIQKTLDYIKNLPAEWRPVIDGKRVPIVLQYKDWVNYAGLTTRRYGKSLAFARITEVVFLARGAAWHVKSWVNRIEEIKLPDDFVLPTPPLEKMVPSFTFTK